MREWHTEQIVSITTEIMIRHQAVRPQQVAYLFHLLADFVGRIVQGQGSCNSWPAVVQHCVLAHLPEGNRANKPGGPESQRQWCCNVCESWCCECGSACHMTCCTTPNWSSITRMSLCGESQYLKSKLTAILIASGVH